MWKLDQHRTSMLNELGAAYRCTTVRGPEGTIERATVIDKLTKQVWAVGEAGPGEADAAHGSQEVLAVERAVDKAVAGGRPKTPVQLAQENQSLAAENAALRAKLAQGTPVAAAVAPDTSTPYDHFTSEQLVAEFKGRDIGVPPGEPSGANWQRLAIDTLNTIDGNAVDDE